MPFTAGDRSKPPETAADSPKTLPWEALPRPATRSTPCQTGERPEFQRQTGMKPHNPHHRGRSNQRARLSVSRAEAAWLLGVSVDFFDAYIRPRLRVIYEGRRILVTTSLQRRLPVPVIPSRA